MHLTRLVQDVLVMSCFRGSEEDCTLIKGFGTIRLAGYTGMGSLRNAMMMQSGFLLVMRSLSLNRWKFEVTVGTYTNSFVTFLSWIYWLDTHAFHAAGHMGVLLYFER